jgi:flavodoxin
MIEEYKKECGTSRVMSGLAVKGTYTFNEVQKWLDSIGLDDASTSS